MADLLYADAMQHLEVALHGSPISGLIDLLADRLSWSTFSMQPTVQSPHVYTSPPSAPPLPTIPIVEVTSPMPEKTSDDRTDMSDDDRTDKSVTTGPGPQEAPKTFWSIAALSLHQLLYEMFLLPAPLLHPIQLLWYLNLWFWLMLTLKSSTGLVGAKTISVTSVPFIILWLYVDPHQETSQYYHWISWLSPGYPQYCFTMQEQKEDASNMNCAFCCGTVTLFNSCDCFWSSCLLCILFIYIQFIFVALISYI